MAAVLRLAMALHLYVSFHRDVELRVVLAF